MEWLRVSSVAWGRSEGEVGASASMKGTSARRGIRWQPAVAMALSARPDPTAHFCVLWADQTHVQTAHLAGISLQQG